MDDEPHKLRMLKKACHVARLDFADLIEQCRDGRAQFHDHPEACAVTALATSGEYRTCYIIAMGGTEKGYRALLDAIEAFARDNGCQSIQGNARAGITRHNKKNDQGFKPIATVFEKVL